MTGLVQWRVYLGITIKLYMSFIVIEKFFAHALPTKNTLCKFSTESGFTSEILTYSDLPLIWL